MASQINRSHLGLQTVLCPHSQSLWLADWDTEQVNPEEANIILWLPLVLNIEFKGPNASIMGSVSSQNPTSKSNKKLF